jgi:hypothetical protein
MKKSVAWIIAIIITLAAAYYQKVTGPTYPRKIKITVKNKQYEINLIRTHGGKDDATVKINLPENFSGSILYRVYPTSEPLTEIKLSRKNKILTAKLPHQAPAGKLEYYLKLYYNGKLIYFNDKDPIIIRFKGKVPAGVLITHIFFMFFAMLLSTLAGILALTKNPEQKKFAILTLIFLFIGGSIMGPIVQKFAFGQYWTGIPFGWDLTDNKTLIALIFWIIAVIANLKKQRPHFTVLAAIVLLLIYSIPHSLFGSQLDPNTGKVIQGMIQNIFIFI